MRLCKTCFSSPWPFVFMTGIAVMAAFVTWLTLGLSQTELELRIGISVAAFLAVEATLVHYVISCMRRHCRHHAPKMERRQQLTPGS